MFKTKFIIIHRTNNALPEIERTRGFSEAVKLKEIWIKEIQSKAIILEFHARQEEDN